MHNSESYGVSQNNEKTAQLLKFMYDLKDTIDERFDLDVVVHVPSQHKEGTFEASIEVYDTYGGKMALCGPNGFSEHLVNIIQYNDVTLPTGNTVDLIEIFGVIMSADPYVVAELLSPDDWENYGEDDEEE